MYFCYYLFIKSINLDNLVGWGNNEKGFIADGSLSVYDFPIMYNKSGTDLENKKIKSIAIGYDFTIFLTGILFNSYSCN